MKQLYQRFSGVSWINSRYFFSTKSTFFLDCYSQTICSTVSVDSFRLVKSIISVGPMLINEVPVFMDNSNGPTSFCFFWIESIDNIDIGTVLTLEQFRVRVTLTDTLSTDRKQFIHLQDLPKHRWLTIQNLPRQNPGPFRLSPAPQVRFRRSVEMNQSG